MSAGPTRSRCSMPSSKWKVSHEPIADEADASSDEELSETERRMLQALGYVE